MKRLFWLLVLVLTLALQVAALGSSVDFTNSAGTLSGSSARLSLSGSSLSDSGAARQTKIDPDFNPELNQIVDLQAVTGFEMTTD